MRASRGRKKLGKMFLALGNPLFENQVLEGRKTPSLPFNRPAIIQCKCTDIINPTMNSIRGSWVHMLWILVTLRRME